MIDRGNQRFPTWIARRITEALELLQVATQYAELAGAERQSFAVEIGRLRDTGLSECDLRWMLSQSLVEHLIEVTLPGDIARTYRTGGISFSSSSCFCLTAEGEDLSQGFVAEEAATPQSRGVSDRSCHPGHDAAPLHYPEPGGETSRPRWNADRRELLYQGSVVKRFRLPSPNQITILSAFEEEEWPSRIDDPLPPLAEQNPKRRLHDTVRNLNRSHHNHLLRFSGDGSGQGVLWEPVDSPSF